MRGGPGPGDSLNGDGYPDIVFADSVQGQVSVAFGNGDGTFRAPVPVYVASYVGGVAAGDFNGDGNIDLIVGLIGGAQVLLGNGDGTFRPGATLTSSPLLVADVNGDGKPDLVLAVGGSITVLFGNGDGTFTARGTAATVPYNFSSAVIGDFNGDGLPDVAGTVSGAIVVAIGNGDGTFQSPVTYNVSNGPEGLVAGNFNGDGRDSLIAGATTQQLLLLSAQPANPDLTVAVSHSGYFLLGQTGTYTIAVSNVGGASTSGTVTVVDTLPSGLTATAIAGPGWNCTLATLTCTRSDALAVKTAYPAITVTVSVASNAANSVVNSVTVSGGGSVPSSNTATDTTTLLQPTTLTLTATPNPATEGQAITLEASITPSGTTGRVTFFDGTTVLGDSAIGGGTATYTTSLLLSGTHSFQARFITNSAGATSASNVIAETINPLSQSAFLSPVSLSLTGNTIGIATGDFNGDGKQDIIATTSTGFTILLGNGNGTFQAPIVSTAATGNIIVVADFNGDGKQDLVFANNNSGLTILLGNGDGTFQAPVSLAYLEANAVVAADFNRDGKPDLAVSTTGGVYLLLGNGDGTFQPYTAITTSYSVSMAVGDVNGDGIPDIVYSCDCNAFVQVLLGNGDGTFQTALGTPLGIVGVVALADFNRDGKLDVVATNGSTLVVALGNGNGTFQTPITYSVGFADDQIVVGDFNGDGKPDVAAILTDSAYDYYLGVFYGNGDGTLQAPIQYTISLKNFSFYDSSLVAGIFGSLGRTDLLVGASGGDSIYPGQPDAADLTLSKSHTGNFGRGSTGTYRLIVNNVGPVATSGAVTVTDTLPSSMTATALAGNGWTCTLGTVSCTRSDALAADASYPQVLLTASVASNAPSSVTNTAIVSGGGEILTNNDSASDVTTIEQGSSLTLTSSLNPANLGQNVTLTATVTPAAATGNVTFYDGPTPIGVGVVASGQATFSTPLLASGAHNLKARYNGDGAYAYSTASLTQAAHVLTFEGFQSPLTTTASSGYGFMADFNGDGIADIAILSYDNLSIYLGNGDGTFHLAGSYSFFGIGNSMVIADFNGDGKPDLLIPLSGGLNLYLGNGDGTFQSPLSITTTTLNAQYLVAGDFNGDGKIDFAGLTNSTLGIWLGNGDGTFQTPRNVPVPSGSTSYVAILAADFNGDGVIDLMANGAGAGYVTVFLGNGDGTFQPGVQTTVGGGSLTIGDFNNDGLADFAQILSGTLSVYLGKGNGGFQSPLVSTPLPVSSGYGEVIVAGDVNGDGNIDLVIGSEASSTSPGQITILAGTGNGTFMNAGVYAALNGVQPIIGEFNGDGRTDLAAVAGGDISVLLGAAGAPDLTVGETNAASFSLGQTSTYTIAVSNVGNGATSGLVTLTETLSGGQTATSLTGTGWSCSASALTCTRSDSLAVASSYPAITLQVTLNYPGASVSATATVSGGGEFNTSNDTATSAATVTAVTTLALTSSVNPSVLSQAVTLTATVTPSTATGTVEFTDSGKVIGYATLSGGVARFTTAYLAAGNRFLRATYTGDNTDAVIASASLTQKVTTLQNYGFRQGVVYPAGVGGGPVTVGDFNGDGKLDIAVANFTSANVSIFFGAGNGTFLPAINYPVSEPAAGAPYFASGPIGAIVAADFNRDGKDDLAVQTVSGIDVLISNGDGTFNRTSYSGAGAFVVGDFNGDGYPDIVYGGSGTVSSLLGRGDGTFVAGPTTAIPSGDYFSNMVAGDVNGDGKLDLFGFGNRSGINQFFGNGDGSFQFVTTLEGSYPAVLLAADINGDGKIDISSVNNSVYTYFNDGTGHLQLQYFYYSAEYLPLFSDFSGDGVPDLAGGGYTYLNGTFVGEVTLQYGNGDGTYQSPIVVGTTPGEPYVAAGDFNGDGRVDLVASSTNGITIFLAAPPVPDLIVSISHAGTPYAGETGFTYTIVATNSSGAATSGPVTVTATLPAVLTATSINSPGWLCTLATLTCTRDDSLAMGASYSAITLQTTVSATSPSSITASAVVSGGGETNTSNDTASDTATVQYSDLTVTLGHFGNFGLGDTGRTYTIVVSNAGPAPTASTVSMTLSLGAGLTATAISGSGWNCTLNTLTCTRSDSLAASASYPAITVTVSVSLGAPSQIVNAATVSGGATASDTTKIVQGDTLTLTVTPSPTSSEQAVVMTATISQTISQSMATGKVTFYDGTTILGIATVASGQAVLSIRTILPGPHSIHAYYSGDSNYEAKSSFAVAHVVGALAVNGFQSGTSYSLSSPASIVSADLNGDGKPDFVVVNSSTNSLTIFLGKGDGTFTLSTLTLASQAAGVAVSDFNGDGQMDLAVAMGAGTLIFLGKGDGTFQSPYQVTTASGQIVSGDFNKDGIADLLLGGCSTGICVLLGNGDGTFQSVISTPAPSLNGAGPGPIAIGDFNGDGIADLALGYYSGVAVLLSNGDGTFQAPVVATIAASGQLGIADFNGDGKLDIATGYGVILGNGDGTFQPALNFSIPELSPYQLTVADFNGDGIPDIAVLDSYFNTVDLLIGNGDGTFKEVSSTPVPLNGTAIMAGDFNADGYVDVAVSSGFYGSNTVNILTGAALPDLTPLVTPVGNFVLNASGTFTITVSNVGLAPTSGTVTLANILSTGISASAISGTGWICTLSPLSCTRSDALAANGSYPPITLTVGVNDEYGTSISEEATVSGGGETNLSNDTATGGATVVFSSTSVSVRVATDPVGLSFTVDGTTYTSPQTFTWVALSQHMISVAPIVPVSAGVQLAFGSWSDNLAATHTLLAPQNNTTYIASYTTQYQLTTTVSPVGAGEVIVPGAGPFFNPFVNLGTAFSIQAVANASQGYQFSGWIGPVASSSNIATTVNMTAPVTVTAQFTRVTGTTASQVSLAAPAPAIFGRPVVLTATLSPPAGTGKVTFYSGVNVLGVAPVSSGVATLTTRLLTAGVNRVKARYDGDSTYASSVSTPAPVAVRGTAASGLKGPSSAQSQFAGNSLAVGDFNGDGKADIVLSAYSTNSVTVLLGNGDGTFQSAATLNAGTTPEGVVIGDFNGDGNPDIAVASYGSSNVSIFLGHGDGTFGPASNIPMGTGPVTILAADLNNDGKIDLITGNSDGSVSVLLGNGDGTFQPLLRPALTVGNAATIVVGDFNGDGNADLALASPNGTMVALGNGDGTFQAGVTVASASGGFAVADVNGDGKPDLIIGDGSVYVLLGNGDGTFGAPTSYTTMFGGITNVAVADFNGDGIVDIAAYSNLYLAIWYGAGNGTFTGPVTTNGGAIEYNPGFVAADFNGDGAADLAIAGFGVYLGATAPYADLGIALSHRGTFAQGQSGATYTITVGSVGTIATSGPVTVTDNLPVGLVATALSGNGWTCSMTPLSCARSDALLPSLSYPPITVTVNVGSQAAASVTNQVTVSGGNAIAASYSATDVTMIRTVGAAALSNLALHFGNQAVGVSSATQTVTVTNIGTVLLNVTNVAASGDFSQTNNCATVASSGSCTITVTFTPTTTGARTGEITVTDNASTSPQLIYLSGMGIAGSVATVSLSALDLSFGPLGLATTSAPQTVTLTNSGSATLTVSSITASGNFAQTNNCGSVAASGTCTINVTFTPTVTGAREGSVVIVDNATGSPQVIRLSGTGTSAAVPVIALSNVSLDFGSQPTGTPSSAQTVTITNAGNATLTITGIAATGDFAASGCVTSLSPGATCALSVTFTPAVAGTRHGTAAIIDNAAGSPQVIQLFGNGT